MTAEDTATLSDEVGPQVRDRGEAALVLAINAARPLDPPAVISLAGVDEVEFGRGPERAIDTPAAGRLRVDLADSAASSQHARLVRDERGWIVHDGQSKNGTLLDGRRVVSSLVTPETLLEIGNSFFMLRHARAPVAEPAAFRTLSAALADQLTVFARVAASRLALLITGETGTGKEVLARTAHELSGRAGPFLAINCGAIPATLVESELFGARKGAYSGATADRVGMIAAAGTGTLFLDEIAELPEPSQASLLRVLQQGEVRPLGAAHPIHVDVRIIAATHRRLADLVAAGTFRDDLHARLRAHILELPPLRERREDIGLIAAGLLPRLAGPRAAAVTFQRSVVRALLTYRWPHNIRELEQVLARALTLLDDDELRLDHLPTEIAHGGDAAPVAGSDERTRLVELLRVHRGNLSAVARALATSRSQVQRLLERHSLDLAAFRD